MFVCFVSISWTTTHAGRPNPDDARDSDNVYYNLDDKAHALLSQDSDSNPHEYAWDVMTDEVDSDKPDDETYGVPSQDSNSDGSDIPILLDTQETAYRITESEDWNDEVSSEHLAYTKIGEGVCKTSANEMHADYLVIYESVVTPEICYAECAISKGCEGFAHRDGDKECLIYKNRPIQSVVISSGGTAPCWMSHDCHSCYEMHKPSRWDATKSLTKKTREDIVDRLIEDIFNDASFVSPIERQKISKLANRAEIAFDDIERLMSSMSDLIMDIIDVDKSNTIDAELFEYID
ncbi:hypothetical protein CYMTET_55132 [Cymbomonas tetramitiformis]|uniref:Apple domain-containing protein n=1 Tax=Cymbomonas tetramitiformis TaxID=36881 RepID=A0AAE0BDI2_9CHLO|nr:hypothetical protein CYMTET_55132 [Cymbomonas tetramitiformis]